MTTNAVSNDATTTTTTTMSTIRGVLAEIVAVRRRQLDSLPTFSLDPVAAAHRSSVDRILTEARGAMSRIEDGTYGVCLDCDTAIPEERLQLRPWAATCARCAQR